MTSVLSIPPSFAARVAPPTEQDEEKSRGRQRSRGQTKSENSINSNDRASGAEDGDGHSSEVDGPTRKRRRSRKGLDKKFDCPHDGCGKSYSRAEHL